jgi:EAL and modified HD-GYP domain-containing signal transduction protein
MPPESAPGGQRFLVRQPLLNVRYQVVGYELGLRDRALVPVLPGAESVEQARDEHLITSVIDLEHRGALGNRLIILDLSPAGLSNPMLGELPGGKVAVALPVSWPDLAGSCAGLAAMGVEAVLEDDGAGPPRALPAACVSVRLDCARYDAMTLGERAEHFRRLGAKRLVARNIDSDEAFEVCRKLAFDLFQGGFLAQPRSGQARRLEGDVIQVMELLNQTMQRAPIDELEAGFKRNVAVTYRLLRYINSPANGLDRPMQSIGQALMWLGHDPLYRWLSLLLFSSGPADERSRALLRNALVRARFMENLGSERLERSQRGGLFIVGILSHLDALLDMSLADAIAPLRLPESMVEALLESKGPYAPYLDLAKACERFDQVAVERLADAMGLTASAVNLAHVNALIWSETLEN